MIIAAIQHNIIAITEPYSVIDPDAFMSVVVDPSSSVDPDPSSLVAQLSAC